MTLREAGWRSWKSYAIALRDALIEEHGYGGITREQNRILGHEPRGCPICELIAGADSQEKRDGSE